MCRRKGTHGPRFNLILEDRQYRTLTAESERQSVSVAELIRRAIDAAFSLDDAAARCPASS